MCFQFLSRLWVTENGCNNSSRSTALSGRSGNKKKNCVFFEALSLLEENDLIGYSKIILDEAKTKINYICVS